MRPQMKMINEKLQMPGNASGASLKYEGAQEIIGWYL